MYPFESGKPQPHATSSSGYNQNSQHAGMPAGVPFGAPWIASTHHSYPPQQQQSNSNYPTNLESYPSNHNNSAPYPAAHVGAAPYPIGSPYPPAPAPYHPSNQLPYPPSANQNAPYPGSSYPHNPQQTAYPPTPQQTAYPPTPQQTAYPPTPQQTPYPPTPQQTAYPPTPQQTPYPPTPQQTPYPPTPQQTPYPSTPSPSSSSADYHQYNSTQHHPTSYNPQHGYTPVRTSGGLESPAGNMQHCFEELAQRQGHPIEHHFMPRKEGTPTLLANQNFDPAKDAKDLRKAMKGFGTDEDTLINIICRRSNEERQEIQRQYKTHFGKDLIDDVKSETSGNFEKLLVGLLRPIVDFYCCELNDAMAGIGTDEDVLIEILCTLSNHEIHTIKNQYLRLYGAHLESELKSETSGNFKRLLVSLCTAARDESGYTDRNAAQADASELLKAGELRVGTDESMFNMILCQRNYQQLKLIFQEYESMTGHSLEKAIKKEFSGDIMEGLIAIYRCCTNKAEYFASRLHKSMAGIGTNDKQLIRVIITRCEIDMGDIKAAFQRIYGKSLKSWIKGDTSGHYKHALYALVGEQRSNT